jgi:HlyD family secretion protein
MNLSMNDECAMLLEGFDGPPVVMMPYNPRYYLDLMAACGLAKAKDLYAFKVDADSAGWDRARSAAAKLPNRSDLIDAAAASVENARHSLEQAEKGLAKRNVFAPATGTVEEVYFRPGEVVKEGQAVIALLPPGNLKVRFFVAEPVRASLHTGQTVKVSCDGCKGELTATISFIAREAEFTPPVIFSQEQRKKLVFLIEARPSGEAAKLTAGQPVSVSLGPAAQLVQR